MNAVVCMHACMHACVYSRLGCRCSGKQTDSRWIHLMSVSCFADIGYQQDISKAGKGYAASCKEHVVCVMLRVCVCIHIQVTDSYRQLYIQTCLSVSVMLRHAASRISAKQDRHRQLSVTDTDRHVSCCVARSHRALPIECVLLLQNVFSYYRIRSYYRN